MTAFDLPDFSSSIWPQGQLVLTENLTGTFNYQSPVFYCGDSLSLILLFQGAGTTTGQAVLVTYYSDPAGLNEIVQLPHSGNVLLAGQVGVPVLGPFFRISASISSATNGESLFMQVFKSGQPLTKEVSLWNSPLALLSNGSLPTGTTVVALSTMFPGGAWIAWALTAALETLQVRDTVTNLSLFDAGAPAGTVPLRGQGQFFMPARMCELVAQATATTGVFIEIVPALT